MDLSTENLLIFTYMPYHGSNKDEVERSAKELAKSEKHYLRGNEFKDDLRHLARVLGIDLGRTSYDLKQARKILGRGKPISEIVSEMRNEQY